MFNIRDVVQFLDGSQMLIYSNTDYGTYNCNLLFLDGYTDGYSYLSKCYSLEDINEMLINKKCKLVGKISKILKEKL